MNNFAHHHESITIEIDAEAKTCFAAKYKEINVSIYNWKYKKLY